MYEIIDVYAAYETDNEYGKIGGLIGIFSSESKAKTAAIGKGWWGSEGKVMNKLAIVYTDGVYLLERGPLQLDANLPELLKKQKEEALKKLTPAEKKLLGLS